METRVYILYRKIKYVTVFNTVRCHHRTPTYYSNAVQKKTFNIYYQYHTAYENWFAMINLFINTRLHFHRTMQCLKCQLQLNEILYNSETISVCDTKPANSGLVRCDNIQTPRSVLMHCRNLLQGCKIWGFHGGDYEECCLLGYKNPVRTSQETHYVSATESSQLMLCKI
jgi:hypothetical protein